jgi:large subunit ribosomal protein L23
MALAQEIIIRPVITEKASDLTADHNQYTFEVARTANKIEIRKAVEMVFGVKVKKVRTQVVRAGLHRVGKFRGLRSAWKKAVVTVDSNDSIDFYGED